VTVPATLADLRLIESLLRRDHAGDRGRAANVVGTVVDYWRKGRATWYLGELERWATARGLAFERPAPAEAIPSSSTRSLTPREREVAALVAEGLSNREIADRLVISERTVEGHVERVLGKLEFRSRGQIAIWLATGAL
jgi:DNA-binding CsgD family transcriptional regulator